MPNSGSVYQRGDGKWCAALQVLGKRKVLYADTEQKARKKLAELQGQMAISGTLPTPGRRTLDDLLDEWLETASPNLKPLTVSMYCDLSKRHIRPHIGKVRLRHLEPSHLQRLCNRLISQGKHRQAQMVYAVLHRALRMAVQWGWLATNPADRVTRPAHNALRKELWSHEQLAVFLDGTKDYELYPLWALAIGTGCRLSELVGLKWNDIDMSKGAVTIRRGLHRIKGEWIETGPKSRAGERSISVPQEVVDALRRQRAIQAEKRLRAGCGWADNGWVFTSADGSPLWFTTAIRALKRACQRLGLPEVTPHGFRHLHASLLLAQGLPVTAVSERLGHSNPGITMTVYAHAIKKQDEQAANAIGQVMRRSSVR